MGVNKSNHTGGIYYNIVNGQVTRRYREHQTDPKGNVTTVDREIKDKNGNVTKVVIEEYYESIDGMVIDAEVDNSGAFGSVMKFTMQEENGGDSFIFNMPLDSSYGRSVLMRIPNIDSSKKITFRPYSFESKTDLDKNGNPKKIVGVTVYQKDCGWEKSNVPSKWTKDNPGSLPAWEKTTVAGKDQWNSDKQLDFLYKHFINWASKIDPLSIPAATQQPAKVQMDTPQDNITPAYDEGDSDDPNSPDPLPF